MILEAVFADEREQALECGSVLLAAPMYSVVPFGAVVYGLCDPQDPRRIRYVGQTSDPRQRYGSHCYPGNGGAALVGWLRMLRERRSYPTMIYLDTAQSSGGLLGKETHWIARLKARGMADLNTAPVRHTMRMPSGVVA